jgi:ABC-type nitrate/sulfonate/bicarbonate transport system permease component
MAIDNALPFAFVAMLFGELYAATAGLGFTMVVASAEFQFNKGFAGFLITLTLLSGISSILRWFAEKLCSVAETRRTLPASVT